MNNPELDKLSASVEAAVRRAYALGRKDALDQLVKYARSDDVASPPLALAPPETRSEEKAEVAPVREVTPIRDVTHLREVAPAQVESANDEAAVEDVQVRPVRTGTGGITGMILDFVYPPKAR